MLSAASSDSSAGNRAPRASIHAMLDSSGTTLAAHPSVLRRDAKSTRHMLRSRNQADSDSDFTDAGDMYSSDSDASSDDDDDAGVAAPSSGSGLGARRPTSRELSKHTSFRRNRGTNVPCIPASIKQEVLTHLFPKEARAAIAKEREQALHRLKLRVEKHQANGAELPAGAQLSAASSAEAPSVSSQPDHLKSGSVSGQSGVLFASNAAAKEARRSSVRRGSTAGLEQPSRIKAKLSTRSGGKASGAVGSSFSGKQDAEDRERFESIGKATELPYPKFIEVLVALAHLSSPDPYTHPAHKLEAFLVKSVLHSFVFKLAKNGDDADWQTKLERAREGGDTQTNIRAIFAGSKTRQSKRRFKYSGTYEDILRLLPKEAASGVGMRIEAVPKRAPPSNVGRWW